MSPQSSGIAQKTPRQTRAALVRARQDSYPSELPYCSTLSADSRNGSFPGSSVTAQHSELPQDREVSRNSHFSLLLPLSFPAEGPHQVPWLQQRSCCTQGQGLCAASHAASEQCFCTGDTKQEQASSRDAKRTIGTLLEN